MPHCRICGGKLRRILTCENMPRAAQHLPIPAETAHDSGVRLEVCECAACGVVQLASAPVPYWKDVIRAVGFSAEMRGFRERFFAAFVERYGLAGKKGIELGCGDGAYLRLLAGTGLHAYGLEHDAGNVERCRAAGLNVHQGYLDEGTLLLESPFDAFFVFSWLEHLPDIPTFLDTILQNLAENAVGIVEVPNFDMILRDNLVTEFIADHLYYFTAATFRRTLENHGLDVLTCSEVRHGYILSAEVRKRPALNADGLAGARDGLCSALRAVCAAYPRVALWGAGHQALTMLAMTGDAERLAYVVDSAPFKQGRCTPVTHCPIVPPDTLRAQPVDALIVAAGSYCDEVYTIARTAYGIQNIYTFEANSIVRVEAAS